MASNVSLPPPPSSGEQPPAQAPTTPTAVSPSPAQSSPSGGLTQMVIDVVKGMRAIAKAAPGTAPGIQKINDIFRDEVMPKLMASQTPGEPQAPPMGG